MRPRVLTIGPYATTDPNAVATAQTPAAGGIQELTIDGVFASGGIATMDFRRQVVLTVVADESARVFVITGTDEKGNQLVEALAGVAAGTASTVRAFTTVTSIKVDDDTAGAVEFGTLAIVASNWLPVNYVAPTFQVGLAVIIGAALTPSFDVEMTLDNILAWRGNDPQPSIGSHVGSEFDRFFPTITPVDHGTLTAVVADETGNIAFPVRAVRLVSNQLFTADDVRLDVVQSA